MNLPEFHILEVRDNNVIHFVTNYLQSIIELPPDGADDGPDDDGEPAAVWVRESNGAPG